MAAGSFITPRTPVSGGPFGGLIDLSRILLQHGRAAPVICVGCQTINQDSAKFCKGCGGKLPAFYTAGGTVDISISDAGTGAAAGKGAPAFVRALSTCAKTAALNLRAWRAAGRSGAMSFAGKVRRAGMAPSGRELVHMVLLVTMMPAALFIAFALWYASQPAAMAPATQPTPSADPSMIPPPSRAVVDRPIQPPPTSSQATRPPVGIQPPDPLRQASLPPAESRAPALIRRHVVPAPLALCTGLSFIAHAVCMNNRCAERTSARHPQCAKALRQRRMDEARRNAIMAN